MCEFSYFMEEKNTDVGDPQSWGSRVTSVSVAMDLHKLAKENGIGFKHAIEFGIQFLIADKIGVGYPDCNLQEKLFKTVKHRNSLLHEVETLRPPVIEEKPTPEQIDKEVNEVFGGII